MQLVLINDNRIDEHLSRTYGVLNNMEENIKFCNKVIRELIDPIVRNKARISVHKTVTDYNNLMALSQLLRSNETRDMFKTIQKDLNSGLPSNLNDIPLGEVKDLLNSEITAYDIKTLIVNIHALLNKKNKAKNDKEGSHIINFIAY